MPFVIRVTDGTDTIDFMSASYQVEDGGLKISPPDEDSTWSDPTESGGASLVSSRFGNREAVIDFRISGGTRQALRENISRITRLMQAARKHSLGLSTTRVAFEYAWDGAEVMDTFEVLTGTLTLPDDVLSVEKMHSKHGDLFGISECELEMTLSANSFGVNPATGDLTELPLSNRNAPVAVTGGVQVYGFTDTYRTTTPAGIYPDSYVEINGADIEGDAPAKVRIEYTPAAGETFSELFIGAHEVVNNAPLFFHWSHPDVSLINGGRVQSPSGFDMAGPYSANSSSWRSPLFDDVVERNMAVVKIRLRNVENYKYKKYRVIIKRGWNGIDVGNPRITTQLRLDAVNSGYHLYVGPMVSGQNIAMGTEDYGVIELPNFPESIPDPEDVELSINLLRPGIGLDPYALDINYIMLLPVENGYRRIKAKGYPSGGGTRAIIDDDWAGVTYSNSPSGNLPLDAYYTPITLQPGKTQRIYFDTHVSTSWPHAATVRVFYAPSYKGAV